MEFSGSAFSAQIFRHEKAYSRRAPILRQTSVLEPAEVRRLLDSIDATTPAGQRDRALVSLMLYGFARIGATLGSRSRTCSPRTEGSGYGMMRKVARITLCPVTIILSRHCSPM